MTSLKCHFLIQLSTDISWNFSERRQIDAGEDTENFASISASIFELSRKSGMGDRISPAPTGARVKSKPRPEEFVNWTEWTEWRHLAPVPETELNELAADPIRQANWTERTLFKAILNWICVTPTPDHTPDRQASTASKAHHISIQVTNPGWRAGISAGGDLELLLTPPKQLEIQWTEPSQPGQSESGPEELVNWTECSELNGCTWPPCPELNWTNFPEKLVARKLNCTELMPNHFELWTRRPCKFTDSSGPGM